MTEKLVTVVIPTLNEERDLPRTLESLKGFADQILIVDSGSKDNTIKIARSHGCKVIFHEFKSFSDTRNFADSQVTTPWILSIEADVVLNPQFIKETHQKIQSGSYDAFFIGRINHIWSKPILHTDWGPRDDCHIFLYKKGVGKWMSRVHEEYKTNSRVGKIITPMTHYNYATISEFFCKIDKYSDLALKSAQKYGFFQPVYEFLKRFIYKKGFLDGYHGLFLSYLQATYHLTLFIKKYEASYLEK